MKRNFIFTALYCMGFAANAANFGSADVIDLNGASGWACASETPDHMGSVHAYRDDGLFLGVLWANLPREQAVADLCGGNGAHGFSGAFSYPASALDGQLHNVTLYFIRLDGTNFVVPGSPKQVRFGDAPFVPQTVSGCAMETRPGPDWIAKTWNNPCHPSPPITALTITWAYTANAPSGYAMEVCEGTVPAGWSLIGTSNASGNCLKLLLPSFTFAPGISYTIRKN